jgi:hypothetical protein
MMLLDSLRSNRFVFIAAIVVQLLWGAATLADDTPDSTRPPVNDGPYIYRASDTLVYVLYLCRDSLVIDTVAARGATFTVPGRCFDTGSVYTIPVTDFEIEPDAYVGVSKVIAISDLHGEYDHTVNILKAASVIDDRRRWIWGEGHLVVVGDIFDRGDKVTECLWLCYRLEQEARAVGGRVHILLGNHEHMVLSGDDRYINDKYLKGIVAKSRIDHEDLFGPDMVLGQWLRSKHAGITINDVLYVHAGIHRSLIDSGLTVAALNDRVRQYLDLSSAQYRFSDKARFVYGGNGPLWYRGLWDEREGYYPKASADDIAAILDFYDVTTMVVGHTNIDSVTAHYDGRVIGVDVLVEDLGALQALLWADGHFYRITGEGAREQLK